MRYAIVIEKAGNNFCGYVPDLPGCVATGATVKDTEAVLREAKEFLLPAYAKTARPFPAIQPHRLHRSCGITTRSTPLRSSASPSWSRG